ncbi:arf-GAP domain and FG repeat-containing protein 1-like isoform X2 [Watersipora subatra]|uniref:arf-GAP domain and FG repeat-containing protein 1-like isoform X2 n=1 Tax=Watersipora subatra TaxID=2589382 RepID=UPI00355AF6CB
MAAAKQQEEKRVQCLRKMVALPHNRYCFDCGQRGPTYVNMTVGSYVCTACSGILRGINPPHRVKSISMASFTQEEVDLLIQRGNEYNKQVWLGLHATKDPPQMDTKDEIKLRDYLTQKYERKRWYQAPTDSLAEEAKVMNSQTPQHVSGSTSALRRPVVGGFRIQTGTVSAPTSSLPKTVAAPTAPQPPPISQPVSTTPAQPTSLQNPNATSADLLSDVFGGSKAAPDASAGAEFSQPNFANFSGAQLAQPSPLTSTSAGTQATNQWSTLSAPPTADNKYASLTGLFSDTNEAPPGVAASNPAPIPAAGGVNWSAINWSSGGGGTSSVLPTNTAPASSAALGINWGTPPSSQPLQPGFSAAPQVTPVQTNTGWSTGAPTAGVNPFITGPSSFGAPSTGFGASPGFGAGQPAQQPFGQSQPSVSLSQQPQMFGNAQLAPSFQAFGHPQGNGQIAPAAAALANGTTNQWTSNQWGSTTNQWSAPANKQQNFANPFLAQTPAAPAQQPSMSTNPFL